VAAAAMRRVGTTHDGVQASERGTDGQTGETRLGDGGVDNPLLAEAVEETLGDLVTAALVSSVLVAALSAALLAALLRRSGPAQPAIAASPAAMWCSAAASLACVFPLSQRWRIPSARVCGGHVRSVVLRDLLSEHEDLVVALHLLGHGLVERLADGHLLLARGVSSPRDRWADGGGAEGRSEGRSRRGEQAGGRAGHPGGGHCDVCSSRGAER
jgi:hypothetical protein